MNRTLVLCINAEPAQVRPVLRTAAIIAERYAIKVHAILSSNLSSLGYAKSSLKITRNDLQHESNHLTLHYIQAHKGNVGLYGFEKRSFNALLKQLKPNYVWIYAEFWEGVTRQTLSFYRVKNQPRIISFIQINHFHKGLSLFSIKWPFISRTRLFAMILWPRLNGVSACATKSMECARRIGLPKKVPIVVNYLPAFGPEEAADEPIVLPWKKDESFTVGFAGTINEQKGWKILLCAIEQLPNKIKVVLVGDGDQKNELQEWLRRPEFKDRAVYTGPLPKGKLLASYGLFDVFVLPSISTPHSVEQFGLVLAEAMACGVPVIGSDSGAIPETIGDAGLVVPEGDPKALAEAIEKLSNDEKTRQDIIAKGQARYYSNFTCEAYALSIAKLLDIQSD
jgi:glycosyltransferase involved in cell wall biosynthesis